MANCQVCNGIYFARSLTFFGHGNSQPSFSGHPKLIIIMRFVALCQLQVLGTWCLLNWAVALCPQSGAYFTQSVVQPSLAVPLVASAALKHNFRQRFIVQLGQKGKILVPHKTYAGNAFQLLMHTTEQLCRTNVQMPKTRAG